MEKLTYYCFSCRVSLKKTHHGKMVRRGRRGRRPKQLLYDLTEKRRYRLLKGGALDVDNSLWRTLWTCRKIRLSKERIKHLKHKTRYAYNSIKVV